MIAADNVIVTYESILYTDSSYHQFLDFGSSIEFHTPNVDTDTLTQ